MDYNESYEQEIDLKDLMFAVLKKWRIVILFAFISALLLGGYKGFSTYKASTDSKAVEENNKKYQEEFLVYEESKEKIDSEISNLETDIARQEEYLEESLWLKLNPYDICEARADLYITTGYQIMPEMKYQNVDYTDTILQVYHSLLTSNQVMEELAEKAGTEQRYLNELVSISKSDRILTINVKYSGKDRAEEILEDILATLDSLRVQVASSIGEHDIRIVNQGTSSRVDLAHVDKKEEQEKKLTDLKASLEAKKEELNNLIKPEQTKFDMKIVVKSSIKFALIGGILGIFIVAFVVFVMFVSGNKVYSSKELKNRYKVKILGNLPSKAFTNPIDRWINKLEGRIFEEDENASNQLMATNVANYLKDTRKLLIISSIGEEWTSKITSILEKELIGIAVESGGNLLKNANALKNLSEFDGVILVEQCQKSKYEDIQLEMEKVNDLQKNVIGFVVID